jgi:Zn-dependent protease
MPDSTRYDVRFRLLGIPVQVHPFFWLVTVITGGVGRRDIEPWEVLLWVPCVFVSILVHEYGHGLMARLFGARPRIALWWLGGLCGYEEERRSPWQRFLILLAGPGAGFLLYGVVYAGALALLLARGRDALGETGGRAVEMMFYINLYWGLVNLLPVYPLDGGRITEILLTRVNPRQALRWTLTVSLVTAGVVAVVLYIRDPNNLMAPLLFASLALTNFQNLQVMHQYAKYGDFDDDDADWWKR